MKKLLLIILCVFYVLNTYSQEFGNQKWKIGLSGGFSFITASTKTNERELVDMGISPELAKKYYRDFKNGRIASANIVYLFKENMGAGVKYNLFTSSSKLDNVIVDYNGDGNSEMLSLKEKLYYNFIGPSFYTQMTLNSAKTFQLTGQVALGYLHYRDEMRAVSNILATGSTFGSNMELGLEYFISKNWALGLNAEITSGLLNKVSLDDGTNSVSLDLKGDSRINMSHIAVLFGIRFYK